MRVRSKVSIWLQEERYAVTVVFRDYTGRHSYRAVLDTKAEVGEFVKASLANAQPTQPGL